MRRQLFAWAAVMSLGALLLWPAPAQAVPVEGSASAELGEGTQAAARDRAIREARVAALELALGELELDTDPAALAEVRARPDAWTTAYRVLSLELGDGQVAVRVEVEVDLPRLRKRVAQRSQGRAGVGFGLDRVQIDDCVGVEQGMLVDPLRAYGIVAQTSSSPSPSSLSLSLRCRDRGVVPHTHVRAVAVEVVARVEGEVELELKIAGEGFAETAELGTRVALDQVAAELADALAVSARGELELRVERPWPAARLTELERRLRDSVLGVDQVELAGLEADGSAILRLAGSLDAKQLGRALEDASFSSFSLVGLRVDGAHALRVRMQ